MKKISFLGVSLISLVSFSQNIDETFKPDGEVQFKVFWNYHTDFSKNATQTSAFELNRAYFGYKYNFTEAISTRVTLDVGNNTAGSKYTAFLKFAQLDWQVVPSVKLSMGVIGLQQFNDQENFWGYRYVFKSFQDENGFGSSADLGINAAFKISENLKANFLIVNGEGFRDIQDQDGKHKVGASFVYTPIKGLITKIYADSQPSTVGGDAVTAFSLFAGYSYTKWKFGAEYNKLNNGEKFSTPAEGHNLNGISFYTTYTINNKIEVFGRYDQLSSNTLDGEDKAWNIAKDGNQIIAGMQYVPVKGFSLSLNYQGYSFSDNTNDNKSLLFLSTEFKL